MKVLSSINKASEYIFTRETNKRIFEIDRRDFKRSLKRSGIEDLHFHDLRHTWASGNSFIHFKRIRRMGNLRDGKKYAHLNADHLSKFSNMVSFWSHLENKDNQTLRLTVVND